MLRRKDRERLLDKCPKCNNYPKMLKYHRNCPPGRPNVEVSCCGRRLLGFDEESAIRLWNKDVYQSRELIIRRNEIEEITISGSFNNTTISNRVYDANSRSNRWETSYPGWREIRIRYGKGLE